MLANTNTAPARVSDVWKDYAYELVGGIGLLFFPVPIGVLKRQLVGKQKSGEFEFYSHPNFVCTAHLIWLGWAVAAAAIYNQYAAANALWQVPIGVMSWAWLVVLVSTFIVMGLRFNRVATGFLGAGVLISLLAAVVFELRSEFGLFEGIRNALSSIPVVVDWGVPMMTSLVLGSVFAGVAAWRRLNDRWMLRDFGNFLEHMNFQHRDRSISKGAKTFVAVHNCLIRRYLLFGYGAIEVRTSSGTRLIDKIEGVFFAQAHAEMMKSRLSATDARVVMADFVDEEEAEEEDAVGVE